MSEGPGRAPRFDFGPARRPRRPSLTPLIDVVFLLLVFFMLAARFGPERAIALAPAAGGGAWEGPPRLVELSVAGVALNGRPVPLAELAAALGPLMPAPDSPVVLRPDENAEVQALAEVLSALTAAGFSRLVVLD